jgi:hypothetical protein
VRSPYGFEWVHGVVVLGAVLILLIVPPFALIAVALIAVAAAAALIALAAAVLASPYLLVRTVRRRLAERHESAEAPARALPAPPRVAGLTG